MQTIKFEIEDELYDSIKDCRIDLQSKFKEFLSNLTDDGFPAISTDEAKKRVNEAMNNYKNGTMQTIPHDEMWSSIDSDCKAKVESRV
jgi:ERCC4-related helicase